MKLASVERFCLALLFASSICYAQSGSIHGTVLDPSGAVIAGATVEIQNPVSHYSQTTKTDTQGTFSFANIPFNPYHLTAAASGFQSIAQDVDVRSAIPAEVKLNLPVGAASTTVTVEAAQDLVENDPVTHTDIDRGLFDKLPLESQSSSLSSLVTLASPGVSADSNGLVSWARRSCVELIFTRRPADYRPAEQGVLESDSDGCRAVHGSDRRRASGRIWRQNQPGDRGDYALGT